MSRSWIRTHNIVKRSIFLICYMESLLRQAKSQQISLQISASKFWNLQGNTKAPDNTHKQSWKEEQTWRMSLRDYVATATRQRSWWRTDGWIHRIHVRVQQLSHVCDHLNFSKDDKVIQWRKSVFQIRGKTAKHGSGKNVPWTSLHTINKCYFKNWYIT